MASRFSRIPRALGLAAAALGACALLVQRETLRAQRAFPVTGRLLDIGDTTLHCVEHGSEEATQTLVLLHGDGSMGEELELSGLPARAARRFRVIVIDRPGYGLSSTSAHRRWSIDEQADLIAAALARLDVHDAIVLGHSFAALVALALARRHPQAVHSLVLVSGYYFPTPRPTTAWLALPALPLIGPLLTHTVAPLVGRLLWHPVARRRFAPAPVGEAFERYPKWMSLRPSQLHATACEAAMLVPAAAALRRQLDTLAVPMVIVAGAGDRWVDARWHSARLHDGLERSWLRLVEGAGHMVHHVAAAQVMAAIEQAAAMGARPPCVPLASERDGEQAHVAEREALRQPARELDRP